MAAKRGKNNLTVYLNVFKKDDDKTPNYRGKLDIEGKTYDVSLWVNTETHGGVPVHLSGQVCEPES